MKQIREKVLEFVTEFPGAPFQIKIIMVSLVLCIGGMLILTGMILKELIVRTIN